MNPTEEDIQRFEELSRQIHAVSGPKAKDITLAVVKIPRSIETQEQFDEWIKWAESEGVFEHPIRFHKQPCNSLNRNAINLAAMQLCGVNTTGVASFGDGDLNIKDIGGTLRTSGVSMKWGVQDFRSTFGGTTRGITVGTGTNAESFEDYVLQTKIVHGSGSGQMIYWVGRIPLNVWDGTARKWTAHHGRYMTNRGGSDITVNEVGLHGEVLASGSETLYLREKLATGVVISNDELLKVVITILSTAYP